MTAFGVAPSSTSPAAKRIYEAGQRFAERGRIDDKQERDRVARYAAEMVAAKLKTRRLRILDRFERAFHLSQRIERRASMRQILAEVCDKHDVREVDVRSKFRSREVARARFEFYWRARDETQKSLPQIGAFVGFDHTAVLNGIRRHEERMREGA